MNAYQYRVTVEALTDARGHLVDGQSLTFEAANHDDLLAIVERVRAKHLIDDESAAAMAIGMKLFAEVVLAHRKDPMFNTVHEALGQFIRELKTRAAEPN